MISIERELAAGDKYGRGVRVTYRLKVPVGSIISPGSLAKFVFKYEPYLKVENCSLVNNEFGQYLYFRGRA